MSSHLPFNLSNSTASTASPPSPTTTSFRLTTHAPTDIWQKPGPPPIQTFNAPILYKSLPLSSFRRARVTVSAPWCTLYDQGGLVLILPASSSSGDTGTRKWIKTGVEFYRGEAWVSTVVADRWADWSLARKETAGSEVTLEMERDAVEGTLWIYVVDGDGEGRVPVREVTWILSEDAERECWVGVYAAKPTEGEGNGELVVDFKGWELDLM